MFRAANREFPVEYPESRNKKPNPEADEHQQDQRNGYRTPKIMDHKRD
jgi:hypothetical protein